MMPPSPKYIDYLYIHIQIRKVDDASTSLKLDSTNQLYSHQAKPRERKKEKTTVFLFEGLVKK